MKNWEYLELRYGKTTSEKGQADEYVFSYLYTTEGLQAEEIYRGEMPKIPDLHLPEFSIGDDPYHRSPDVDEFVEASKEWFKNTLNSEGWIIYNKMIAHLGLEGWEMIQKGEAASEFEGMKNESKDVTFKRPIET